MIKIYSILSIKLHSIFNGSKLCFVSSVSLKANVCNLMSYLQALRIYLANLGEPSPTTNLQPSLFDTSTYSVLRAIQSSNQFNPLPNSILQATQSPNQLNPSTKSQAAFTSLLQTYPPFTIASLSFSFLHSKYQQHLKQRSGNAKNDDIDAKAKKKRW
jgi:hypothetical protein